MRITKRRQPTTRPRPRRAAPTRPAQADARDAAMAEYRRRDEVARASGGPRDQAVYHCDCGRNFTAPVSAGVQCPGCGEAQAW